MALDRRALLRHQRLLGVRCAFAGNQASSLPCSEGVCDAPGAQVPRHRRRGQWARLGRESPRLGGTHGDARSPCSPLGTNHPAAGHDRDASAPADDDPGYDPDENHLGTPAWAMELQHAAGSCPPGKRGGRGGEIFVREQDVLYGDWRVLRSRHELVLQRIHRRVERRTLATLGSFF